tara:strand:- start:1569 stop:1763 length:195 start_codon:yes stop_codon:yes gene_type:complete
MARKKKKIFQPIREVEIINRRTKKRRKIYPLEKETIIYNEELNEFQLLPHTSASYEVDCEPKNG